MTFKFLTSLFLVNSSKSSDKPNFKNQNSLILIKFKRFQLKIFKHHFKRLKFDMI